MVSEFELKDVSLSEKYFLSTDFTEDKNKNVKY